MDKLPQLTLKQKDLATDRKNRKKFLDEYKKLCKKHNFLIYSVSGYSALPDGYCYHTNKEVRVTLNDELKKLSGYDY